MTRILKNSGSDDPYRPQCSACDVEMWLVSLKRSFARGEMKEQRSYECLACGLQQTVATKPEGRRDVKPHLPQIAETKNGVRKSLHEMASRLVKLGAARGSARLRDDERG